MNEEPVELYAEVERIVREVSAEVDRVAVFAPSQPPPDCGFTTPRWAIGSHGAEIVAVIEGAASRGLLGAETTMGEFRWFVSWPSPRVLVPVVDPVVAEIRALVDPLGHSSCFSDDPNYKYLELARKILLILDREKEAAEGEDLCGLCGKPGADKVAHPNYWPGERRPTGPLVHAACEDEECRRAHAELSDAERAAFLRSI